MIYFDSFTERFFDTGTSLSARSRNQLLADIKRLKLSVPSIVFLSNRWVLNNYDIS